MTKPISRKMAVDCLLDRFARIGEVLFCQECGEALLPGQDIQFDHIHADVHGGAHEYRNLRPIHYDPCHKRKTSRDVKANAKVKRLRNPKPSRHPMPKSHRKIPSRPFQKKAK